MTKPGVVWISCELNEVAVLVVLRVLVGSVEVDFLRLGPDPDDGPSGLGYRHRHRPVGPYLGKGAAHERENDNLKKISCFKHFYENVKLFQTRQTFIEYFINQCKVHFEGLPLEYFQNLTYIHSIRKNLLNSSHFKNILFISLETYRKPKVWNELHILYVLVS